MRKSLSALTRLIFPLVLTLGFTVSFSAPSFAADTTSTAASSTVGNTVCVNGAPASDPASCAYVSQVMATRSLGPGHSAGADWVSTNGPITGGRYSSLSQINTSNAKNLVKAWTFTTKIPGTENYPVIINGVAYVTTSFGDVFALDAATGKQLWSYNPSPATAVSAHGYPNRGVAVGGGLVYLLTPSVDLVALDQKTGKQVYKVQLADPSWYSESTSPIYYNGVLYIGSAGSETGARGFEEARDAKTGALIWQHYTVPPQGAPGSWDYSHHGGGAVWMPPTLDPADGLLYIGTGNPSPDYYGVHRPGPNHWTDSVMALDMKTGKMVWAYQEVPHDLWDYDAVSPPVMFPTGTGLAVGEAGKDGYWYEMSAKDGTLLTFPAAFVKEQHVAPPINATGKGVINWPGSTGGSEWSPVSYDPQTGYTYVEGLNAPNYMKAAPVPHYKGGIDFGTVFTNPSGIKPTGTLTAFNVATGQIAWQNKEPTAQIGGTTTTAGGVLFAGQSGNGIFQALDASTGKVLWQYDTKARIDDAASVYAVNGTEYVLIPVGGSSLVSFGGLSASNATFIAFKLGQASAAASATVQSSSVGTLGNVLVNQHGMTLYYNTQENAGKIACTGTCAGYWPPLLIPSGTTPTAGSGVDGTLGTITRPDGSTQVTYDGHPLYTFVKDGKAGDANGHGVKNIWYAMPTSGPSASSGGSSSSSSGS